MAMTVGQGSGDPDVMVDINTTPLIDVMLVLLIMLIITIPIQTHAVKLNMPVGNPPPPTTPPEVVRIDVDFDGAVYWNGEMVPDRPTLEAKFRGAALSAASRSAASEIETGAITKEERAADGSGGSATCAAFGSGAPGDSQSSAFRLTKNETATTASAIRMVLGFSLSPNGSCIVPPD